MPWLLFRLDCGYVGVFLFTEKGWFLVVDDLVDARELNREVVMHKSVPFMLDYHFACNYLVNKGNVGIWLFGFLLRVKICIVPLVKK